MPSRTSCGSYTSQTSVRPSSQLTNADYAERKANGAYYRAFLEHARDVWRPALILNTGDTTDAIYKVPLYRRQVEGEWAAYIRDLQETGWTAPDRYLEVLGNHDAMGSGDPSSPDCPFFQKTEMGRLMRDPDPVAHPALTVLDRHRIARYTYPMATGNVSFILLNTPEVSPGFTVPSNFYGNMGPDQLDIMQTAIKEAPPGVVISAAHQPVRWVQAQTLDTARFGDTLSAPNLVAHLSGHTHRYGLSRFGEYHTPEINTGVFRPVQRLTVMAVDHGIASFSGAGANLDARLVITNPKPAHHLSAADPLHRIGQSTHVRVLALGLKGEITVTFTVDDEDLPGGVATPMPVAYPHARPASITDDTAVHLLTAPWTPADLTPGLHVITVSVTDAIGTRWESVAFSVDGTVAPFATINTLSPMWSASDNTVVLFTDWPRFWLTLQITVILTVIVIGCLPVRAIVSVAQAGSALAIDVKWRRSPVLLVCALVFVLLPNFIVKLNRNDWAFVFSFGVISRGSFTIDPFLFAVHVIDVLIIFLPAAALIAITSVYTAAVHWRHHTADTLKRQMASGQLLKVPRKASVARLLALVDVAYLVGVVGLYGILLLAVAAAYVVLYHMWAPTAVVGVLSILISPSLFPIHAAILASTGANIIRAAKLRFLTSFPI